MWDCLTQNDYGTGESKVGGEGEKTLIGWLSILLLDDQGTHVVTGLLIVLGMGTIAVREFLGLPTAAVDGFGANVFHIKAVHHLGAVFADCRVDQALLAASLAQVLTYQEAPQRCHYCHGDHYGQLVFRYSEM